jgi:hypothetical protein
MVNSSYYCWHFTTIAWKCAKTSSQTLAQSCFFDEMAATVPEIKDVSRFMKILIDVWLPLWFSGQSSWLQIQMFRVRSFWEVVDLERGQLILVTTIDELLERKSSGSGLENRKYGWKGSVALTTRPRPLSAKVGTDFADRWRLLVGIGL